MAKRTTQKKIEDELKNRVPALRNNIATAPVTTVTTQKVEKAETEPSHVGSGRRKGESYQKERDKAVVEEYESIPDYNVFERAADSIGRTANKIFGGSGGRGSESKSEMYARKSELTDRYNKIINQKTQEALNDYQASGGDKIPVLAGVNANEILHPFQYAAARKEIEPLLQQYGVSFEQLEDFYRKQALEQQNQNMASYAKDHPILATGASFVTNAIGGLEGAVGGLTNYLEGKPMNANQALTEYGKLTPTIRETVKEGIGNPVGQTLYDVETSIGDMLYSIALGGGSKAASLGLMSTNAGANTLNQQMDKDTDPWQKVATATASGAVEAITELLPMESLFRMVNNPAGRQTAKQLMVNVLKQAGMEAGEEAISDIANNFVDGVVNGSQSDYNQNIQSYMAQGMTEDQARLKAETDIAKNAAYSALVGGLSGGVMGGGANVINNINYDASLFAPEVENAEAFEEYNRSQKGNENEGGANIIRLPGLETMQMPTKRFAGGDILGERVPMLDMPSNNNWTQELVDTPRGNTPSERIRSMTGFEHDVSGNMANKGNNRIPSITAPVEQQAPQIQLKPLESYNAKSVNGFPEITKMLSNYVNLYGKGNDIVAAKYAEAIQNLNRYIETYDNNSMNAAVNAIVAIDEQLKGKVNTSNKTGKKYTYRNDSIIDDFFEKSNALREIERHNALGESLPQAQATSGNIDYTGIDKTVGMFGNNDAKKAYGQFKQYVDRYAKTGDESFLEKAREEANAIGEILSKAKPYKTKANKVINYNGKFVENANKIIEAAKTAKNAQNTQENINPPQTQTVENIETVEEKPQRTKVMAENAGLGNNAGATNAETESVVGEKITKNADGTETLTIDPYADEPNSTQTSRNSMYRYFEDMPDVQKLIEAQRKEGKFDKEVHTNQETLDKAELALNQDEEAVKQNLLTKEYVDEVDTAESLMLARKMFNDGNMEEGSRFLQNLSYKVSTPGRVLQLLGAMAGTGEGAIIKANALIKEETGNFFNRPGNKPKKERCGKLATALKNIGNDHTNDPIPQGPKTYQQIKQGVINELEKESSSVFDIFNDTDIDYLARMVERGYTADEIQYKLEERLATGSWDIKNEDLQFVLDKFNEANKHDVNSKAAAELQMEAYQRLAEYLPDASFMEKWNNWRYLAMLGNPRTHIRNLVGNFMFGNIVSSVADELGGALEATTNTAVKALGGKGFERTKTAALKDSNLVKASEKYGLDHAWAQLADVKNKYSDMKRDIASERRIFKNKALEGYRKVSGDLLTKSDEISLMNKYKRAMAGYLQANGKNASIFNSQDPADQAMIKRASDYAVRRAKEATFHEDNKIAEILTNWSQAAKNKGGVAGNLMYGLEEALIPFKKTPANILKQALEYSPANAINLVKNAVDKNPAMFIENISKTMTGSGIMALGAILAAKGLLRAKGNEKDADLDKLTGEQDFSLNLGDDSYTLDWAAPAALPLFVGARLYENSENENGLNILDALASVGDPLVEMSMLQGISNTIQSVATFDKKKNGLVELGMNIGYNYLGQAVPTIAGQLARSIDDTRRTTYTGKEGVADTFGKLVNKTKNKIPGLSKTNEPYVDAWGETQENAGGNFIGRLANNMIFPWYYSNTQKTATENELYRLNRETNANIVPKTAETSYDGKKLNPQEYTEYATIKGQDAQKLLGETIENPRYATLDDAAKAELLSDMLLFSNALAKNEAFGYDIGESNTYKKKYEAYQRGGVDGLIDYITLKDSMGGSTSMAASLEALESLPGLSDSDKVFYFKQGKKEYSKEAQYLDRINETYAYDWYKIQNENGKKKDDMIYGIYTSDLPEEEKQVLLEVLNMDKDELIYELTVGK